MGKGGVRDEEEGGTPYCLATSSNNQVVKPGSYMSSPINSESSAVIWSGVFALASMTTTYSAMTTSSAVE